MLAEITDGISNTILLAESDLESAVHWMSPSDMDLEVFLTRKAQSKSAHFGGRHAVMADVAVKFLTADTDKEFLRAMATVDGGEILNCTD